MITQQTEAEPRPFDMKNSDTVIIPPENMSPAERAMGSISSAAGSAKMNARSSTPFMPKKRPTGSRKPAITPKRELSPIFI